MENKVVTKEQLQKRIARAVLHVDRTRETKEVYFDDKGLRLIVCEDCCIVGTNFHRHVFNKLTSSGFSRPYLYVSQLVDFALENDCTLLDSKGNPFNSYTKLIQTLLEKEDRKEYNIAIYVDWWLFNIFNPLYTIAENAEDSFHVYFDYLHNIAFQHIRTEEHKDGMTNKQFVKEYIDLMTEYINGIDERQVYEPLNDEEREKREMEAMAQMEQDEDEQSKVAAEEKPKKRTRKKADDK